MRWSVAKGIVIARTAILGIAMSSSSSASSDPPQQLITSLGFSQRDVGFILIDLKSGTTLAEQNADRFFLPASVAKLVTAYAALEILGPSYRFSTLLYRSGPDIYLKGGGDPVLASKDLQALAFQLRARAAQDPTMKQAARLYYDDSLMVSLPKIDSRQPIAAAYNSGLSALDVDFNRIEVEWSAGPDGARKFLALCPADELVLPAGWISFSAATESVSAETPFIYVGEKGLDRWLYSPHLALQGTGFLPVKSTSLHAALLFRTLAQAGGLSLAMPAPRRVPPDTILVGRIDSDALGEILRGLLRYSNNASAELIGLAASRKLTGESLSLRQSATALKTWLERSSRQLDLSGVKLQNHSGLSSESRISPRQIVEILRLSAQEDTLLQALPASDGLRGLKVKSGSMDFARGLAGYFNARDGRRLAFAIFIFDSAQRAARDATMDPRVLDSVPAAAAWSHRAAKLDEALLQDWMTAF